MATDERLLRTLFFLIWGIVGIHLAAEVFFWYWTFRWFDQPMHLLGGVWLGYLGILLYYYYARTYGQLFTRPSVLLGAAVGSALVLGVVWECYEFLVWQMRAEGLPVGYTYDTVHDLVLDVVGAAVGVGVYYVTGYQKHRSSIENTRTTAG